MRTRSSSLRNVTLSAEANLIDRAREIARERHITLNDAFREWLRHFASEPAAKAPSLAEFSERYGGSLDGKVTREEANERR